MAQTLQNQITYAKSMNGIVTLSDGAGTTISNGTINTDNLDVVNFNASNFTANNVIVDYMQILRDSNPVVNAALGFTVDVGLLVQNMNFDDINRFFQIWNDTASSPVFLVDVSNNIIDLNGTSRFNTLLPTTTITTGFANNNFITKAYSDGIYGRLASANSWSSTNTFNSFLPTSTLTPSTNTELITKLFADTTYGRLAIANTWAENNTFSKGILPRAASSATDIQIGGVNQLQYRTAPSAYNISIGENAVQGYTLQPTWNVGQRNIGIGDGACKEVMGGNDNIGIGYRALKSASGGIYGQTVTPFRCIAIGSNSQTNGLYGTDNISIGYNSLQNIGSGNSNICIGSSTGNAIANVSNSIIIGSGAGPSIVDNAMTVIGYQACGAASSGFNSGVALGSRACYRNAGGAGNTAVGADALFTNTTGFNNTAIGCFAGYVNPVNLYGVICLGRESTASISQECVLGGESAGTQVYLTLPNKTRLACNQFQLGVTINLTFRTNENVLLTDNATTTINLPTPNTDGRNEGCKFYINRRITGGNITINAPAGQTIGTTQLSGSYGSSTTYLFLKEQNSITLLCIGSAAGGINWLVLPTTYSQGTDNIYISTVVPIPATQISIPFAGTTVSGYQPYFMDNANLSFTPLTSLFKATNITSSGLITSNNLTVTGTLSGTATNATNVNVIDKTGIAGPYYMNFTSAVSGNLPVNADSNLYYDPLGIKLLLSNGTLQSYKTNSTCYQYLGQGTLITTATTIGAPLLTYYPFTMKTAAAYAITVPQITSLNVGTQLVFKRLGGSLQALSLTTVSNQPTFLSGNAIGTTTATNVIISATQSCCKIIATETQNAGAGTFSNGAGSATITIDTQTSGTLAIGGAITLNGNVRFITAYGTGLGGTGTYTVNTAIVAANAGQPYTSSLSYGWAVESIS